MKSLNEVKESMQMLVDGGCDGTCVDCRYNGPVCLLTTVGHALEHICTLERIRATQASTITSMRDAVSKQQLVQSRMYEEISCLESKISRLESQIPRWIPVEARLPEDGKYVIVNAGLGGVTIAYYRFERKEWFRYAIRFRETVTHWMPLPEPPKEEE